MNNYAVLRDRVRKPCSLISRFHFDFSCVNAHVGLKFFCVTKSHYGMIAYSWRSASPVGIVTKKKWKKSVFTVLRKNEA